MVGGDGGTLLCVCSVMIVELLQGFTQEMILLFQVFHGEPILCPRVYSSGQLGGREIGYKEEVVWYLVGSVLCCLTGG